MDPWCAIYPIYPRCFFNVEDSALELRPGINGPNGISSTRRSFLVGSQVLQNEHAQLVITRVKSWVDEFLRS